MTNPPVLHLSNSAPRMEFSEAAMYLVWAVVILLVVVTLFRRSRRSAPASTGRRSFSETVTADGWFAITALPAPPATPYAISALIPAAFAAAVLTAIWVIGGHSFEASAWFFWITLMLGVMLFRPLMRRRDHAVRNVRPAPFHVRLAGVRLPDGEEIFINAQYAVTRRNSAPYGHSATADAHHVDVDVEGVTYVLAGGMDDQTSMAVYNQVRRRLKGEP